MPNDMFTCMFLHTYTGLPGPGVLYAWRDRRLPGKPLGKTFDVSSITHTTMHQQTNKHCYANYTVIIESERLVLHYSNQRATIIRCHKKSVWAQVQIWDSAPFSSMNWKSACYFKITCCCLSLKWSEAGAWKWAKMLMKAYTVSISQMRWIVKQQQA